MRGDILHPDSVVRRYWALRESLAAPKAAVPYVTSGSSWADRCFACNHTKHHRVREVERCARCSAPWVAVDGKIPKGRRSQPPRPQLYDVGYAALGTAVALIEKIPEPAKSVYVYFLDPARGGLAYAVSRAVDAGALASPISDASASRLIASARRALELFLRRSALHGDEL